jgi:hypothetical protein
MRRPEGDYHRASVPELPPESGDAAEEPTAIITSRLESSYNDNDGKESRERELI